MAAAAPAAPSPARRMPLVLAAVLALLAGMYAGLVRVGWPWPALLEELPQIHGALMVCGFLGTVIGLERAVALGRWWAYAAPLLAAAGAVALVAGLPSALDLDPRLPRALFLASAAALLVNSLVIVKRQPALFTAALAAGVGCWAAGNALWLDGRPLFVAVFWWAGFLVLTIAAERLELTRVTRPTRTAVALFVAAAALLVGALVLASVRFPLGARATGIGFLALAAWLVRCDVARRTIRVPGLTRFIASGLLSGYFWLAAAGVLALAHGKMLGTLQRDALYHALFLGFVMAMIFAHAPVILPAVAGVQVPFTRAFYVPLGLLHASLALRVGADHAAWLPGREWGALLNVVAILAFVAVLAARVLKRPSAIGN